MEQQATRIIKRASSMKSQRAEQDSTWRDCYDYTYPMRGAGLEGTAMSLSDAGSKTAKIYDSTATDSTRLLASAMMAGMTPANAQWLDLDADNLSDEEKDWFSESATIIWTNIHAANFDAEAYEANLDSVIAGWFVLYVQENVKEGGYNFQQWHLSQCSLASTRPDLVVDTIAREYKRTAAQAISEFGEEAVGERIRDAAAKNPDQTFTFLQFITPRTGAIDGSRLAVNMPFASYHIDVQGKRVIRESGYHEFPCAIPRWMRIPGTVYGIGPVFDALPDIRTLNELKRQQLAATDLAIAGMWIAEDDGVLNPRTVKVGPRKIIVANSVDSMKPLLTGSDFNVSFTKEESLQASIRKILMADQLQPQNGPAMTATEVNVRVGLIRQLLGPVYGRFQAEFLAPLVERCFGLAFRAGALPQLPDSLVGKKFNVRYLNPLARAQKMEDVGAIERFSADIGQLMQVAPDIADNVNFDEAARVIADGLGVPVSVLRTKEDVDAFRKQKMEQAQAAQQQQMAAETMSSVAQDAGGAMVQKVVADA
ncbi:phage tail protein [Salmonella enterica]|nr:phage tail protein [Salmonella enterica]EGH0414143.1 phage tail protein [Salmonella enterica subsp. enterica serovar Virchow]